MDIYIVRKCRVEILELPASDGEKYTVPVMTQDDIHSFVIKEALSPEKRDRIQRSLENFYIKGEQK